MAETMNLEIEVLKREDVEESVRILQSLARRISPTIIDAETLGRAICGPHALTLVAKDKHRIVGVIHGTVGAPPSIVFLGTEPREGLWSMLVDKFIDQVEIKSPTATSVRTNLPTDMPEVVAFYSSKGFLVDGFVKDGYQGRDIVYLHKVLTRQGRSTG